MYHITNSKTTAYRNTLEEIKVNLTDRIGGEIRVRRVDGKLVLDFLTQYGVKSDTTVELAKNMKSLNVKTDSTNIITRLIPLGTRLDEGETAERLTVSEINDGKPYIDDENAIEKYGIIVGTAEFDDITLPENLIEAGQKYLQNNNRIKKAYSAEVLDLSLIDSTHENLKCGNTYRFRNSFMGLDEDLRLTKRTVDIYKPFAPTVEIGDKAEKITDVAVRTNNLIEYELPK
ncbi:MAG: phage tail protein [Ruminococcus sp.]|nr:phage tail protein [Ruminococcus sp.]